VTLRLPGDAGGAAAVLRALRRALPLLLSPRLLGALLRWLGGAIALWLVLGLLLYGPLVAGLAHLLGAQGEVIVAVKLGAIVLLLMAALVTVLVAVAVFTMPVIVRFVAERYFPALERRRGGTWHGGLRNALVATLLFVPAWLLCLPLLAVPPLYVALTWCLGAWFNQRLFRYDALADHADREELARLPRRMRGRLFALGLVLAPLALVPFAGLLVPLFAGIAFACLCLDALAQARRAA
jgi:hypothetical protein